MSWWRPASDLSQRQMRIIESTINQVSNTPSGACVWVQGCAGTGKTLVLAHIAKRLKSSEKDSSIIFLTYTNALTAMIRKTISQSGISAGVSTHLSFLSTTRHRNYDVIFLDEIQDVKLTEIVALKNRCTHLVVAGDCEQGIYEHANTESEIDAVVTFEKRPLIELFRITGYIVKVAQKIMPWTKLVEGDTSNIKRDVTIAVRQFEDCAREAKWVYSEAIAFARPGYPGAILLPRHEAILAFCQSLASVLGIMGVGPEVKIEKERITDYIELNKYFEFHNVPVRYLGNGIGNIYDADGRPFVFLMTYHSAKGLDFDQVYMPLLHAHQGIFCTNKGRTKADAARILFFVAITRTRERLFMSYTGDAPHAYIEEMPKDVVSFVKDDPKLDKGDNEDLF
jgi:superfamily I DNA/RNA helicase